MSSKKTNGDEPCRCRFSSLAPHRKKKCSLFGKKGILVSPDAQIQNAIAFDKEKEDELDQSPESIKARVEKAVAEATSGTKVKITVTVETEATDSPVPPSTEDVTQSPDADTSPPAPPTEEELSAPNAASTTSTDAPDLSIDTPASTQANEHETFTNSPLSDPFDDLMAGLAFERDVPIVESDNDTQQI